MGHPFAIRFGGLAPPLVDQFKAMGIHDTEVADKWQAFLDARTFLYLNGCLSDGEDEKVCGRIGKLMVADLEARGAIRQVSTKVPQLPAAPRGA